MQLEEVEKQLDLIQKIITIALQFGVGIGAIIILIYSCKVGYYPSGLTVGDGLFFIAVALSFGFSYSIVAFFLFCTAIVLTPLWRFLQKICLKITKKSRQAENLKFPPLTSDQIGIAIIGVIGIVFIIISIFKSIDLFIGLIISVGLMAFCYLLLTSMSNDESDSEEKKNSKRKVRFVFIFSIYLIPLVVGRFQSNVLDQTMRLIGVRNENAVVQFKDDYKNFVASELGEKIHATYKATVLFHGFGTSSVLEISGKRFVVPNKDYFLRYE